MIQKLQAPVLVILMMQNTIVDAAQTHYAESVAMTAHAEDGMTTFDVRIARFPEQNQASLWLYIYVDGGQYSLVDNAVALTHQAVTPVQRDDVTFAVRGSSSAELTGTARYSRNMRGVLRAEGFTHAAAHPEPGGGTVPVAIDASFAAQHEPINVRAGRIEVMGRIEATITIADDVYTAALPGKWHEQTGIRPDFAPAFTYLFLQGENLGLMATKHARGAWGYVYRNGLGVTRDDAVAAVWYRRAAERGQPEAQYELALMYELGLGVPQDPAEASLWYGLSAAQACPTELSAGGRLGDR